MSNFLNRRVEEVTKLVKGYIESSRHLEQMLADTFKDFTGNKASPGPEIFGQGPMYFLSKQRAGSLKEKLDRIKAEAQKRMTEMRKENSEKNKSFYDEWSLHLKDVNNPWEDPAIDPVGDIMRAKEFINKHTGIVPQWDLNDMVNFIKKHNPDFDLTLQKVEDGIKKILEEAAAREAMEEIRKEENGTVEVADDAQVTEENKEKDESFYDEWFLDLPLDVKDAKGMTLIHWQKFNITDKKMFYDICNNEQVNPGLPDNDEAEALQKKYDYWFQFLPVHEQTKISEQYEQSKENLSWWGYLCDHEQKALYEKYNQVSDDDHKESRPSGKVLTETELDEWWNQKSDEFKVEMYLYYQSSARHLTHEEQITEMNNWWERIHFNIKKDIYNYYIPPTEPVHNVLKTRETQLDEWYKDISYDDKVKLKGLIDSERSLIRAWNDLTIAEKERCYSIYENEGDESISSPREASPTDDMVEYYYSLKDSLDGWFMDLTESLRKHALKLRYPHKTIYDTKMYWNASQLSEKESIFKTFVAENKKADDKVKDCEKKMYQQSPVQVIMNDLTGI